MMTSREEPPTASSSSRSLAPQAIGVTSLLGGKSVDEYDPVRPNDYEEFCQERKQNIDRMQREEQGNDAPLCNARLQPASAIYLLNHALILSPPMI